MMETINAIAIGLVAVMCGGIFRMLRVRIVALEMQVRWLQESLRQSDRHLKELGDAVNDLNIERTLSP